NLSVLVTPEQAHVLMLASNKGKLQMALRNGEDKSSPHVAAVDDKIFDEIAASKGAEKEDLTKQPTDGDKKKNEELKQFLQASAPPVADAGEEVWAIEIFD